MKNFNQITNVQRDVIQVMLANHYNFTEIGKAIGKDRTAISKEIRRNRYLKSDYYKFSVEMIEKTVSKCNLLQKPPYVCNFCTNIKYCVKGKLYYNAKIAQKHYDEIKKSSRQGIDIDSQTIDEIEHSIVPLIKDKKQSVNQVYTNHLDILYMSKPTFYKYVNIGVFSLTDIDLPKKVKYKKRKKKKDNEEKRQLALLNGRRYSDFLLYSYKHPSMHIVEMDTVIGLQTDTKVLLTLYFRDTHFMIIRLLEKKNVENVNASITKLKDVLGITLYSKIFKIILTDRGVEFYDPYNFEKNYDTGSTIAHLFYCDPNCPDQKGGIEKNHEYIRKVLSKKKSFQNITDLQVKILENQINNIPRDSLNGKTPFELTKKKYPAFIKKLGYHYISPDDVTLNPEDILGGDIND